MSLNLIRRALKDRRVSISIFGSSLFLYAWLLMALAPTFIKNIQFKGLIAKYPKAFMSLATGASNVDFFRIEGFMTIEFFSLWMPIIVFGFIVAFATAIVAKEIGDGTMDFLLSQPLSRNSVIISRFASLVIYLVVLVVVAVGSPRLLAPFYDVTINSKGIMATMVLFFTFMLAIASFSLFLSVVLKERGQAIIVAVSAFVISHLLNALSDFNNTLKKFRFLSIFKYYQPYKTLTTGEVPWRDISILFVIMVIFFVASLVVFRKKDIPV